MNIWPERPMPASELDPMHEKCGFRLSEHTETERKEDPIDGEYLVLKCPTVQ